MSDRDTIHGPSQLTLVNPTELAGKAVFGKMLNIEVSYQKTTTP